MKLEAFSPPGLLTDFNDAQRAAWSRFIARRFARSLAGAGGDPRDAPRDQFFDPIGVELGDDVATLDIQWSAFPKQLSLRHASDRARWRAADRSRDVQDEYCEWSVERDAGGKVKRVTFTSEGPEYWNFLASSSPELALDLYRQHVSPTVRPEDLFDAQGRYIERNRWNSNTSTGAMHLIQQNNTLGAEIELAAAATIQRSHQGVILTTEQDLVACSQYGVATRHSDPHIGGEVNGLARQNAFITLADPVGLYLDDLSTAGWETPDGADPKDFWRIVRGAPGKAVRAVYEVSGHDYLVGDIKILGKPIEFGAQIVDFVTIRLTGLAHRFGQYTGGARACLSGEGVALEAFKPLEVEDLARPGARSRR